MALTQLAKIKRISRPATSVRIATIRIYSHRYSPLITRRSSEPVTAVMTALSLPESIPRMYRAATPATTATLPSAGVRRILTTPASSIIVQAVTMDSIQSANRSITFKPRTFARIATTRIPLHQLIPSTTRRLLEPAGHAITEVSRLENTRPT